jgi:hypothetical protein
MRDLSKDHPASAPRLGAEAEIPEEQWDHVAGGRGVGSQTGAIGPGKIVFNPFPLSQWGR